MWPDRRIIDLFKTEFPILLAPMAGVMDQELAIAAAQGGALPSLPCALLPVEKAREVAALLNAHDIATRMISTDRPGYVVYEDDFQVAAEPFRSELR